MIIVEIGNNYIKAIWGKAVLNDVQINGIVVKPLKAASQQDIINAISSILPQDAIKRYRPLVLSLSRNRVTLKNLRFPSKDKKELDNIVNLHLTQQVPYSKEEIVHNYVILEKTQVGFAKILLGVIHKELLRKQFYVLDNLNLYPENIQLSTFGLTKFLERAKILKNNDTELKACLDIDVDFSDLLIFKGNKTLFSKNIPMGHSEIEDPYKLDRFIGEIKQAIVAFKSEEGRGDIVRLYISGMLPKETALKENINTKVQLPVDIIEPAKVISSLRGITNVDLILKRASFTPLFGIAMDPLSSRGNFELPEARLKKDIRETAKNFIVTGSIVAYLIVLCLLALGAKIYGRQAYLNKISEEISAMKTENTELLGALDKIRAVKKFRSQKDSFLYYYYRLTEILPRNITTERIIFQKGEEFSLIGKATDMGEIFKFVQTLDNAKTFGRVELRYSRKKTKGKDEFNEFEIMCHLGEG